MRKFPPLTISHPDSPSTSTQSPTADAPSTADELICIPDYLLQATSEYRDGQQYYEACLFDEAQSKFVNAVNCIAVNDPIYKENDDFCSLSTSGTITFLNKKCDQSIEKKLMNTHIEDCKDEVSSMSKLSRSSKNMGQLFHNQPERWGGDESEERTSGKTENEEVDETAALVNGLKNDKGSCCLHNLSYLPNDALQGVICVMLTDITMALALCSQMKGKLQDCKELYRASSRLHSILYGPESLRPVIPSANFQGFFPEEYCSDCKEGSGEILLYNPLPNTCIHLDTSIISKDSDYDIGFCEIID